ncbi:hypothetical protein BDV93DRAFT_565270 [Ceratobasidium sp. AG-I]|nr:hypothetical protein BDV93DRAFT_565270 [Ceratobasidium sp. AG-I]
MPPRKRPSLREKVTVSPDPSRPATPEPTTSSGVSRGRALYDNSPPDSQADDLGRTQRRCRSTSRGITWAEAIEKSATRSHRVRRTRARNSKKKKAHTSVPGAFHDAENTDGESQGTSISKVDIVTLAPSARPPGFASFDTTFQAASVALAHQHERFAGSRSRCRARSTSFW